MSSPSIVTRDVLGAPTVVVRDGSLPVVGFRMALRGGTLVEPAGRSGITAHLLELMLRGTKGKSRAQLWESIERLGASIWLGVGKELAVLGGTSLARNTASVMTLLQEILNEPALLQSEHERLMGETLENLRSERDDDESFLDECLRYGLYRGHPMQHSVLGTVDDVGKLTVSALCEARATRLTPSNVLVGFSGDIAPAQAEAHTVRLLQDLPRGPKVAWPDPPSPPERLEIVVGHKPGRAQVQMALAYPTISGAHPDALALWLGVMAFGGMFTSRLNREIRDKRGWSYSTESNYSYRRLTTSAVSVYAAPGVADAVACFGLCVELYRDLAQGRIEPDEIRTAKDYTINRFPLDYVTCHDYLGPSMVACAGGLPTASVFDVPSRLEALEAVRVQEALRSHLSPEHFVGALVGDADQLRPMLETQFPDASIRVIDYREDLENS